MDSNQAIAFISIRTKTQDKHPGQLVVASSHNNYNKKILMFRFHTIIILIVIKESWCFERLIPFKLFDQVILYEKIFVYTLMSKVVLLD